jgi:hypothetical protein
MGDVEHDGYVPDDLGVGGGDYVELDLCLNCGTVAGEWPLPKSKIERKVEKLARKTQDVTATTSLSREERHRRMWGNAPLDWEHLNRVADVALANPHGGADPVLAVIFEREDPAQVIACVVELFQHPELLPMAQAVYAKFDGHGIQEDYWEHWVMLKAAVKKYQLDAGPEDDKDEDDDED